MSLIFANDFARGCRNHWPPRHFHKIQGTACMSSRASCSTVAIGGWVFATCPCTLCFAQIQQETQLETFCATLRLWAPCVKQLPRVRCDLSCSAVVDNRVSHVHVRCFIFVVPCLVVVWLSFLD